MRHRVLLSFLTLTTALLGYLFWRTVLPLREWSPLFWVLVGLFSGGFLLFLWMPLFFWSSNDTEVSAVEPWLERGAHVAMGFFSLLLLIVLVRDIAIVSFLAFGILTPLPSETTALLALGTTTFLFVLGVLFAAFGPFVKTIAIDTPDARPGVAPLRIVQISDLHVGTWIGRRYVERVVRRIEAAGPLDLLVFTGDIGDGDPKQHAQSLEPFRRLKPRLGSFSVTGNHEGYWGAVAWNSVLEDLGFRILRNQGIEINDPQGRSFTIHGVDDARPDLESALRNLKSDCFSLLLIHQPDLAQAATQRGVSLVLAGHTHAGQFAPWSLVIRFVHRYARGRYQVGPSVVYVNSGTGYWGPPLRLGSQSEISRFEIR